MNNSVYPPEYENLHKRLDEEIAARKEAENISRLLAKRLNCLYGLADHIVKYKDSLDKIFSGMVRLLPAAFQYQDITCARIACKAIEFKTDKFKITPWVQSADMRVFGKKAGTVEVYLLEERPAAGEGPFLEEERQLIGAIAERLGRVVERKELEEELILAKNTVEENYKKLRDLEDLKESLIHMIVHDLNNPLSVMVGYMQLMNVSAKDRIALNQEKGYDLALLAGKDLQMMISTLLDISKMEDRTFKLRLEYIDLADIGKETIDKMKLFAATENKSLSLNIGGNLPKVLADLELIKRVFDNLVKNALKYSAPRGKVLMKILCDGDAKNILVKVEDTGEGIPEKYLNKIFDKFIQIELGNKLKTGYGLGLTFCKMAVEAHGGKIWVESTPGRGSIFTFTLPLSSRK